jgi:uncharacterized membrane protein YjdF
VTPLSGGTKTGLDCRLIPTDGGVHAALTELSASRREHDSAGGSAAWTIFSAVGLAGLLIYLLIRQAIQPGFTDYWGFMVAQIAVTLVFVVAMSSVFAREGGLSWYTHLVVTGNTWADTLGTAGHLYERHVTYDKVTHFLAGVVLTAAAADVLRALNRRGWIRLMVGRQLALAVAIALLANIGWELYEYVGDVVFQSEGIEARSTPPTTSSPI